MHAYFSVFSRSLWLETEKRNQETEMQRQKMQLDEKEAEKEVLTERLDHVTRQLQTADEKATSLQLNLDRVNLALARSEEGETQLKDKVGGGLRLSSPWNLGWNASRRGGGGGRDSA